MKLIILVLSFSTPFFNCTAQSIKHDSLFVESVSFNAETIIRISCADFEDNFQGHLNFNMITSSDTIALLNKYIEKAKFLTQSNGIDVRAKFILKERDGRIIRICMNNFDVMIDGRIVADNEEFYAFLVKLIETSRPNAKRPSTN